MPEPEPRGGGTSGRTQSERARAFLGLHKPGDPLLLANAWDMGSARILESLGYSAIATTSSGFAATLGRLDGSVTRAEAIAHAANVVSAVDIPVSADLENAYSHVPEGVRACFELALAAGLAGASVEDYSGDASQPIYDIRLAQERVEAAVEAAHSATVHLVVTARAENYLHGRPDISDTIARLQAFREAGADVVYAPGMGDISEIRRTVEEVGLPVNVLVRPGGPGVSELAAAGVARISVGGSFAFAAYGALVQAASGLQGAGTLGWFEWAAAGSQAARTAFAAGEGGAGAAAAAGAGAAGAAGPAAGAAPAGPGRRDAASDEHTLEDRKLDEQGDESFPASDPPSNWAGPAN